MVESLEIYWHVVYCTKFHKVKHPQNILKFNYGKDKHEWFRYVNVAGGYLRIPRAPFLRCLVQMCPHGNLFVPLFLTSFPHDLCPTQHSHSVFVGNFHFMSNIHYISYGRVAKDGKKGFWIFQRLIAISILGNSKWRYCSSNMV